MGDIQCDILSGDNMCCIFVRFVDTTNQKITSFKSLDNRDDPEIFRKVTHVLFYRGILPTFPSELGDFFPNLKFIEIYDCGMMKICGNDLKGFPNLEKLKLDFNQISSLPANLFECTPKISQISFASNRITKICPTIFDKLEKLIRIDLTRNIKINYKFSVSRQNLPELKRLIREYCQPIESLVDLSMEIFSPTPDISIE
ncbi:hypothetical protein ACKWTF_016303 [Chironomus riparius]